MTASLIILAIALFMIAKGATMATRYAGRLAENLQLSKYTVGFLIIAVISVLPEALISINAALKDESSFGLGMLLGSNVADLTLIFGLVVFLGGRSLAVESKILKSHALYPFILLLPIVLGFDGHFSRIDGAALLVAGGIFYYLSLKSEMKRGGISTRKTGQLKNSLLLLFSLLLLLTGAHFTVTSATDAAAFLGISSVLIGMLVVGLGTTMPELFFSLKSVRSNDDSLAIGDLLGTVLADATIVIGILALLNPFTFPKVMIYVAGVFMVAAAFILFTFMRSGYTLTKREAFVLFFFWATFAFVEFIVSI